MKFRKKLLEIGKFLLLILALYLVLKFLLLPKINSPEFREFTQGLGFWGYFVVIGYIVLSHVFAPVAGTPGVALGITIYGVNRGMWLLYIGSLISATINFFIAKRFGRSWVTKFVGKKSIKEIDEFTAVEGREVLLISRLFGFALFDFISYAAGLTNLKYKDYIVITAVSSLITNVTMQLIFRDIDFQSELGIMIWVGSIFVAALAFGFLLETYLKKRRPVPFSEE